MRRRARSEPGGTRWRTGGEVKGKLANGVGSQYSHAIFERGVSSITQADAHTSAASSRLNWRPHRFKWTSPFRGKTKSGFCACAITFRMSYTTDRLTTNTACMWLWSEVATLFFFAKPLQLPLLHFLRKINLSSYKAIGPRLRVGKLLCSEGAFVLLVLKQTL